MKSYNGLWDQMMTTKNIVESIENAHRGKGKKLKKKHYKLLVWLYKHRFEEKTQNLVRKYHGRFLDCMGYRIYCDRIVLRKSIMVRMVAKANEIAKARHITLGQCRSMFSYNGYLKVTKTHNVYLKFIKPKISFKYLRKRISAYDRRINGMENCSRNPGRKAEAA